MTRDRMPGVCRVGDDNASDIEPAFDSGWLPIDMLRWRAAVTHLDTGLDIGVTHSEDDFVVRVGLKTVVVGDFDDAWSYIVGAGAGRTSVAAEIPVHIRCGDGEWIEIGTLTESSKAAVAGLLREGASYMQDAAMEEAASAYLAQQECETWEQAHADAIDRAKRLERDKDRDNRHHRQEYDALSKAYDDLEKDWQEVKVRAEKAEARAQQAEVVSDERTWLRTELEGVCERAEQAERGRSEVLNKLVRIGLEVHGPKCPAEILSRVAHILDEEGTS